MNELPCMNCKHPVATNAGKFFAEVFLCEKCFTMAEHFYARLLRELQFLVTMSKEAIRVSLVQGKFSFPEGPAGEVSKRAVLEEIMRMEEARSQSQEKPWPSTPTIPTTPSSETTPPHVRTLAALGAASSRKDSPPD